MCFWLLPDLGHYLRAVFMDCDAGISFEYLQFTRTATAKGIEANVLFLGHSHIFSLLSQFHTRPGKARRLMKVRSQRFFCLCASHFLDLMLIFQKQCQRSVKVLPSSAPSCHARLSPSFIPLDPRHIGLSERFEHSYVDQQTADLLQIYKRNAEQKCRRRNTKRGIFAE